MKCLGFMFLPPITDAIPAAGASDNIWVETSIIDGDLIAEGVRRIGAGRIVFGSAAPLSAIDVELAKVRRLPLPDSDLRKMTGENAAGLLG